MDERPTFGSLFSGIGGLDLGIERAGWRLRWHAEVADYACRVLDERWPGVPNHGDVRERDWSTVERVHCVAGGFPCQDISSANTAKDGRRGLAGEKSGLWFEFARAVDALRPRWVVVENVETNGKPWMPAVRTSLADLGYSSAPPLRMRADRMGYNHRRTRLFVVAHADSEGQPPIPLHEAMASVRSAAVGVRDRRVCPARIVGMADGRARGLDASTSMRRCEVLGNAVMPDMGERIGRLILAMEGRG